MAVLGAPPLASIAPMEGGLGRVFPLKSVVSPGMATPAPTAGLLDEGVKLKLSRTDSAEIGEAGVAQHLERAR